MTELHYLTATEALRLFRSRELSPTELMAAVIARAEAVEPTINAFAETRYEQAMDQAREAEAGMRPGPRPGTAGGPAGRGEGGGADRRPAQHARLAAAAERGRAAHGGLRAAHHRRRGHRARPVDDAGVLLRPVHLDKAVGRHPQPVEHRVLARRVQRRVGRGARRGFGDAGHRLGHRRVDPDPRVVLRGHRVQAAVRAGAGAGDLQPGPLLPRGAAGPDRRRLRAAAERHRGAALERRRVAPAEARDPGAAGAGRRAADRA